MEYSSVNHQIPEKIDNFSKFFGRILLFVLTYPVNLAKIVFHVYSVQFLADLVFNFC